MRNSLGLPIYIYICSVAVLFDCCKPIQAKHFKSIKQLIRRDSRVSREYRHLWRFVRNVRSMNEDHDRSANGLTVHTRINRYIPAALFKNCVRVNLKLILLNLCVWHSTKNRIDYGILSFSSDSHVISCVLHLCNTQIMMTIIFFHGSIMSSIGNNENKKKLDLKYEAIGERMKDQHSDETPTSSSSWN